MNYPPLVLTMGEPAGVGPELIIKAKKILKDAYPFYVIGDFKFLTSIAKTNSLGTQLITHPSQTVENPDKLCIWDQKLPDKVIPGQISLINSSVVKKTIKKAVMLVLKNQASAMVTNPINKWALKNASDFPFEGHTDYLASLDPLHPTSIMMLTNLQNFRVVPVTIHLPLKQVSSRLNKNLLENTIRILYKSLRQDYQIKNPSIVVTGLNPHAGENSTMGYEEIDIIVPVIKKLNKLGFNLTGPLSADIAFTEDKRLKYDAFVCMYHDQALIPVKTLSFDESINVTLGLSFIRTSPDHGTALDIAGKNIANPKSLILAIKEAQKIADVRRKDDKKK